MNYWAQLTKWIFLKGIDEECCSFVYESRHLSSCLWGMLLPHVCTFYLLKPNGRKDIKTYCDTFWWDDFIINLYTLQWAPTKDVALLFMKRTLIKLVIGFSSLHEAYCCHKYVHFINFLPQTKWREGYQNMLWYLLMGWLLNQFVHSFPSYLPHRVKRDCAIIVGRGELLFPPLLLR